MPVAERYSEKQTFPSRANVKFWGQSLTQGHYPPIYQQARKGFICFIIRWLIFSSVTCCERKKNKNNMWARVRMKQTSTLIGWFFINNNNDNKLKISIALFPDVIKSALQKFHIKLNTILKREKVKNKVSSASLKRKVLIDSNISNISRQLVPKRRGSSSKGESTKWV